ncbi:hypothetical protein PEBR_00794 [Penicillium brasilianum]|uniref:Uncharacterized protein n=1 Tax=Penicillium brasilianum TaxID=104259 RepID=A0A1S9S1A0_PENBI|nr:hypothetical protein PEBR_00794 [Penicillium brasilianum]
MGSLDEIQTLISNLEDEEVLSIKPKTLVHIAVVTMCTLHSQCYRRIGILGLRSLLCNALMTWNTAFAMDFLDKTHRKVIRRCAAIEKYTHIELGKQQELAQITEEILTLDDD